MSCPGDAGSTTEPAAALSDAGREARPPPRVLHREGARAHPTPCSSVGWRLRPPHSACLLVLGPPAGWQLTNKGAVLP